jgi:hypothetical protein
MDLASVEKNASVWLTSIGISGASLVSRLSLKGVVRREAHRARTSA